MGGTLVPGQKLREAELCLKYEASRATVREALRILEAERLIDLIPNRGPFVAKLTLREIDEIEDVWSMLTGEAVYRFSKRCNSDDLAQLDRYVEELKQAVADGQPLAQLAATNNFFYYIIRKTPNRILQDFIISTVIRLNFLRSQTLLQEGWSAFYVEEIERIVEALRARSPDSARNAVSNHITTVCAAAKEVAAGSAYAALTAEPWPTAAVTASR